MTGMAAVRWPIPIIALCSSVAAASVQADATFTRPDGVALEPARVDATVERLMRAGKVPGLALALIGDGKLAHLQTYGMADASEARPLNTDTVMYGASLSKAAFAWMVMTLVDEGAVDLDRPISELLPKPLPQYDKYADLAGDDRWRQWTLRMLLSHQAGLPNWRWISDSKKQATLWLQFSFDGLSSIAS